MHFIEALFGGTPLLFCSLAAVVVLAILGVGATVTQGKPSRDKQIHRLAILEVARIDGRRNVVLIQRGDTEYLLLTGGPQDLIIDKHTGSHAAATAEPVPAREAAHAAVTPDELISDAAAQLARLDRRPPPRAVVATRAPTSSVSGMPLGGLGRRAFRFPRGRDP